MQQDAIQTILDQQRHFFNSGATRSLHFRITQLKKLKSLLEIHEAEIAAALKQDLNKAKMEAVCSEILLVIYEMDLIIKQLKKWSRAQSVKTPFFLWPGRSRIYYEPYGSVLIIGPWNYPFMLILSPLIGAMSAGNCIVIKPSEIATHTEKLITHLFQTHFQAEYISVLPGGPEIATSLLKKRFDYIFFTGSAATGKEVMRAAAEHLTPVTLELGGKSPCIVDADANLDFAAARIIWAKTMNAGQICVAPDYLYVHETCKAALVEKLKYQLQQFYGAHPEESASYCRIINQKQFDRLSHLLQQKNILWGGQTKAENNYIAPTLLDDIDWHDPIMQEEIFGPILPILTFTKIDTVIQHLQSQPKPLAFYLFTRQHEHEKKCLEQLSFGGGCINDCVVQVSNPHLPFGGVGQSGMGIYKGRYSFETFSHRKSVYKKSLPFASGLEYPPYSDKKLLWIRRLLKI